MEWCLVSQDTRSAKQMVRQMLEVAKKVGAGVAAALVVSVIFHLLGLSHGWYVIVMFTFFLLSLLPSWNAIKGPFRFAGSLTFGVGMEFYRFMAVAAWLALVISLRDGALITPALALIGFAFFAGFFRFCRDNLSGVVQSA